jgi:hypothetical protein
MHENRITKPVEIVLRRGKGGKGRTIEGRVNLIKIYSKHICKCHNVYSLYSYCMLILKRVSVNSCHTLSL